MRRALTVSVAVAVAAIGPSAQPAVAVEKNCTAIQHRGLWNGTENQPIGITKAAPWGFAEVDAQVLLDGTVVALHDFNLRRLTGGDTTLNANQVTWPQLQTFDHPYGPFQKTTRLINQADTDNTRLMVTINRWGDVKSEFKNPTLDSLYAASRDQPTVWFGGADDAMRARHPDARTFVRYNSPPPTNPQVMIDNIKAEGVDLAGIPRSLWTTATVRAVKAAGALPATPQTGNKEEAREAQAVGIQTIQGNNAEAIATRWCQ